VGVIKIINQSGDRLCFFERGEVSSLEVFYEADFEATLVIDVDLNAGDVCQTHHHGGMVAALSGDDLELAIRNRADENGFEDPLLSHGLC